MAGIRLRCMAMSAQKRALVVDDSRSARLVLRRMLEKYDLAVDTVESASLALDYLIRNRPDVIFMDHMMPGMDGFEAIRAIKDNPATATIPVMMYTSRGGDLYLGQARALGAVGVLPKTVAPAELFSSLKKIGLIRDRRKEKQQQDEEGASERAEDLQAVPLPARTPRFTEPGMPSGTAPKDTQELDAQIRRLLEEQSVEFRKDVLLSMETVARQTGQRLNRELEEKLDALQPDTTRRAAGASPLLVVLALLLLASLFLNIYLLAGKDTPPPTAAADDRVPAADLQLASKAVRDLEARNAGYTASLKRSWLTTGWALNQELSYPFNEIALDEQRVDIIAQLMEQLSATGYRGTIVLETHAGEFCLLGDQESGFRLPPPEMTLDQCAFTGNPVQPTDSAAAHQSLRFANFINSSPLLEEGRLSIEVVAASREDPLHAYPDKSDKTTAQEWNRVARDNNRVVVRLEPE